MEVDWPQGHKLISKRGVKWNAKINAIKYRQTKITKRYIERLYQDCHVNQCALNQNVEMFNITHMGLLKSNVVMV